VYVNVNVSGLSIPDCPISNVLFLCMSMSISLDCLFLIVTSLTINIHKKKDVRDSIIMNGQSRDTDIDIQKKKTLEMGQSGMGNLETLSRTSFSCACQCQCL
jgi:hypothetical protein